jgi:hypothetical protein
MLSNVSSGRLNLANFSTTALTSSGVAGFIFVTPGFVSSSTVPFVADTRNLMIVFQQSEIIFLF